MINNTLSEILGKRRIKISDISKGTGLSRSTLTNLYYQRTNFISLNVLDKLCDYLNCSIDELLRHSSTK